MPLLSSDCDSRTKSTSVGSTPTRPTYLSTSKYSLSNSQRTFTNPLQSLTSNQQFDFSTRVRLGEIDLETLRLAFPTVVESRARSSILSALGNAGESKSNDVEPAGGEQGQSKVSERRRGRMDEREKQRTNDGRCVSSSANEIQPEVPPRRYFPHTHTITLTHCLDLQNIGPEPSSSLCCMSLTSLSLFICLSPGEHLGVFRWGSNDRAPTDGPIQAANNAVPYVRRRSGAGVNEPPAPSTLVSVTTSLPPAVSPPTATANVTVTSTGTAPPTVDDGSGGKRRSNVPPSRDEEAEAQRKHRSAVARRERRSTQSVTQDDIKAAEQQIKSRPSDVVPSTTSPQIEPSPVTLSNNKIGAPSTPSIVAEHEIETERLQRFIEEKKDKARRTSEGNDVSRGFFYLDRHLQLEELQGSKSERERDLLLIHFIKRKKERFLLSLR